MGMQVFVCYYKKVSLKMLLFRGFTHQMAQTRPIKSPVLGSIKSSETIHESQSPTHKKYSSFKRLLAKLFTQYVFPGITPTKVIGNIRGQILLRTKLPLAKIGWTFSKFYHSLEMVTYHTMDKNAERNPKYQGENQDGTYDVVC